MKKYLLALAAAFIGLSSYASAATLNNAFTVDNSYPGAGGSAFVSSSCGAGSVGNVSFSLTQNGQVVSLPSYYNLNLGTNGAFSGTITYPNNYSAGPATLTATCPNGDVINVPLTFQAPASSSFNVTTQPAVGGRFNLAGSCGGSMGVGSANISITSNGVTTPLQTVNLSSIGTFTTNVFIPSNINTGNATLTANCSNGQVITSAVNVGSPEISFLSLNTSPTLGSNNVIAGNCGANNTSGAVSLALIRNGVTTPLVVNNANMGTSGTFSSTITYPSDYGAGVATLLITCPGGASYASPITLTAAAATNGNTGTDNTGNAPCDAACLAALGGPADENTPVGGVDAGQIPPADNALIWAEFIALIMGAVAVGLYGYRQTIHEN